MKPKKQNYFSRLRQRQKENRKTFILYTILRALVIVAAVRHTMQGNYGATATCILVLALFLVPSIMEERLKIKIPPLFEGIIYVFIFAAEILGEVNHFYVRIPGWDTMLHTINGFLCAAAGFSLVYLLNRNSKNFNLSPIYLTFMAFCFSMTVGIIWEFFEFGADLFLGMDTQKDFIVQSFNSVTLDPTNSQQVIPVNDIISTTIHTANGDVIVNGGYLDIGIIDTMKDLFVNFLGAIVFCAFGFVYCIEIEKGEGKSRKGRFVSRMLLRTEEHEEEHKKEHGD
ncbi:MAG: hypothetical protein ACOX4R_06600 [Lentihominibacter sp.]|jgi:hypothetical protein